jgi:hypothetical protein
MLNKTRTIRGEIAAVDTTLGMISVTLRHGRLARYVLPLAARSQRAAVLLLAARARRATVALRVRGAALVDVLGEENAVAAAA